MSEIKLTVSQAAGEIGETVHVLRNWMKEFKDFLPLEKSEGGYNLFTQDAIDVLQKIKRLHREENLSTRQIVAILSGAEKPKATEDEEKALVTVETLRGLLEEQRTFNIAMLQRIEDQQKSFEDFVQRRDAQVLLMLNEMEERKKRRRPWYRRMFRDR